MVTWAISNFLLLMMLPWIILYVYVGSYLWWCIFWKIPRNGIAILKVDAHIICQILPNLPPTTEVVLFCPPFSSVWKCQFEKKKKKKKKENANLPGGCIYYTLIMKHFIKISKWLQIQLLVVRESWRWPGCSETSRKVARFGESPECRGQFKKLL